MALREDASFQRLLDAACGGDAAAWQLLYHELAPLIIGYLRAQRLPDAEDVAGEVLLEVVRDLHRFRGDAANLRSWVLTIAHHRLLDARRRAQRRPQAVEDLTDHQPRAPDDPEAEVLARAGFGSMEPHLADLTEDQRAVLLLRVIGDLSVAEVAEVLDRRPGAVRQLQHRAVTALRQRLDESDADQGAPRPGVTDWRTRRARTAHATVTAGSPAALPQGDG